MSFLLPLLFCIFSTGTLVFFTKRRFEEVLPLSLMLSALIVYLFGFFDQMAIGFYACIILATLFPLIITFSFFKKNKISEVFKRIFTPGFLVFILIYGFLYFLNIEREFTVWDEISHWGPMVKETLRLDRFYSVSQSASYIHRDYPPIICIFQTIWCKLSGGYKEAYLYISLQLLSLSLFLPALSHFQWRKHNNIFIKLILIFIVIISTNLIVGMAEASFYTSIYLDCILGLMLAYSISLIFYEKKITNFGIFRLSIALSFLLLTKQMALVFFLLVIGIFLINHIIINHNNLLVFLKKRPTKKVIIKSILIFSALTIIPYSFVYIWNNHIESLNIVGQFKLSSIRLSNLIGIIMGTSGKALQHTTFINYISAILTTPLILRPIALAYWQLMLATPVLFYVISKYGKNYFTKYQISGLNLCLIVGAVGYSIALLLLYIFAFDDYEGPNLASFYRYENTYWFAVCALATMLFISVEGKRTESKTKSITVLLATCVIIFLITLAPASITNFVPAMFNSNSITENYKTSANFIKENTEISDRIFVVSQHDNGLVGHVYRYLLMPQYFNFDYYSLGKKYVGIDVWTKNITLIDWKKELSNFDYLYLHNIDDQFVKKYKKAFKLNAKITDGQLYEIIVDSSGKTLLKLVK